MPLAALGVGTGALSSVFWIFNFLAIATQTEVAQTTGRGDIPGARNVVSLALLIGIGISLLLSSLLYAGAGAVSTALGAEGARFIIWRPSISGCGCWARPRLLWLSLASARCGAYKI